MTYETENRCPVCRLYDADPALVTCADVFALGFVAGVRCAVQNVLPTICAEHLTRLTVVARCNGIELCEQKHEGERLPGEGTVLS